MADKITLDYEADLKDLKAQLSDLKQQMKGAEDSAKKAGRETAKSFDAAAKSISNVSTEVTRAGASINSTVQRSTRGAQDLTNNLNKVGERTAAGFNKAEVSIKGVSKTTSMFGSQVNGLISGGLAQMAGAMAAAFGVQQVIAFGKESVQAAANFEKAVSELSSITGVVGDELEFYKQAAKELSVAQIGGVNVTASAEEITKAFSLVGSAKPELLASKEALKEVTTQAIILAEASGLTLPDAVKALTDVMNQFGAPAEEARNYIDALAAGAKYGAAAIPQVSEAMVKFGAAAKLSNVSVVESTALIETLADRGIQGAEAGTSLRNILLKLANAPALPKEALNAFKAAGVDVKLLSDNTIPLETRLREVAKVSKVTGGITKVFGTENAIAALNILNNIDRYKQLSEQIGETGVAMEQAGINTNNTDAKLKQFHNQVQLIKISLGDALVPALLDVAKGLSTIAQGDFSSEGIGHIGTTLDRLTIVMQTIPSPLAGVIRGIKLFKQAFDELSNGNIIEGAKNALQGFGSVITFGISDMIIKKFTPAKKELVQGLTDIEKAGIAVKTMTDQELNIALNQLAATGKYTKEQLSQMADELRGKALAEIFTGLAQSIQITSEQFKILTTYTDKYGISARTNSALILEGREAYLKTLDKTISKEEKLANQAKLDQTYKQYSKQLGVTRIDFDEYLKILSEMPDKTKEAADGQEGLNNIVKDAKGPYEVLTSTIGKYLGVLRDMATLNVHGKVNWDMVTDAAHTYAKEQNTLVEVNDKVTESLKRPKEALLLYGEATEYVIFTVQSIAEKFKLTEAQILRRDQLLQQLGITQSDSYLKQKKDLETLEAAEIKASNGSVTAIQAIIDKYKEANLVLEANNIAGIAGQLSSLTETLNNSLSSIFGDAAQNSVAFASFQKAIALTTIALKSAEAIASGIAAVAAGASSSDPIKLIGGITSIIAGVGNVIGGILQTVRETAVPAAPSFFTGTAYLERGNNPKGIDTIPINANEGEAIIPTARNASEPGLAQAWIDGNLDRWIINNKLPDLTDMLKEKEGEASQPILQMDDERLYMTGKSQVSLLKETNSLLKKSMNNNKNPWSC